MSPASKWTRSDAIRILAAVADFVGEIMDTVLPESEGMLTVSEHRTTTTLRQLGTALADLDDGIVDKRFKTAENKKGAAYTTLERQTIDIWMVAVEAILTRDMKLTRRDAEKKLAASLGRQGFKFRGKPITAANLDSWRRQPPGKRK